MIVSNEAEQAIACGADFQEAAVGQLLKIVMAKSVNSTALQHQQNQVLAAGNPQRLRDADEFRSMSTLGMMGGMRKQGSWHNSVV